MKHIIILLALCSIGVALQAQLGNYYCIGTKKNFATLSECLDKCPSPVGPNGCAVY